MKMHVEYKNETFEICFIFDESLYPSFYRYNIISNKGFRQEVDIRLLSSYKEVSPTFIDLFIYPENVVPGIIEKSIKCKELILQ